MTVKVTSESTIDESTRTFELDIVSELDFRRPNAPSQMIRPEHVRLTFKKKGGEPWTHDRAIISGPRILTNGRQGSPLVETFYGWNLVDAPQWMKTLSSERLDVLNGVKVS